MPPKQNGGSLLGSVIAQTLDFGLKRRRDTLPSFAIVRVFLKPHRLANR
jgi:hypothetical protein